MLFLYFLLIYIFLLLFRKRESRLFSAGFSFFICWRFRYFFPRISLQSINERIIIRGIWNGPLKILPLAA